MNLVYCFIDDTDFELDNFRAHAAWAFEPVQVVYAKSVDQAQEALRDQRPLCFLLDLYGTDPACADPAPPPREEMAGALPAPLDLEELYRGAAPGDSEAGNRFLRQLYGQVQGWQAAFLLACRSLGQGSGYGLGNLREVRRRWPWAAALSYSRKALYGEGAAFTLAGGDGVLQKPQGGDEQAIAQATRRQAPDLARTCHRAVRRRLLQVATPVFLSLQGRLGHDADQTLLAALALLGRTEAALSRDECAGVLYEIAPWAGEQADLLEAVSLWLAQGPAGD